MNVLLLNMINMVEWKHITNHKYRNYHSDPHAHRYEHNERYPGGKETRVNHD